MWDAITKAGGPSGVSPSLLREMRVYGGAQGIWVDKLHTQNLTESGTGATVSLLHTGTVYPDDLSEDGVLYHYPDTQRPAARDKAEVDATRATQQLRLPVFVITARGNKRDVRLGWVEDWDDDASLFLVRFGDTPASARAALADEEAFQLTEAPSRARHDVAARPGQQRFKFRVLQRYGPRCAVCSVDVLELLEAAHIRPKSARGSDDPRNGLLFCVLHHRAFDAGLFTVEPGSLVVSCPKPEIGPETLRLEYSALHHLERKPHSEALGWHWNQWRARK